MMNKNNKILREISTNSLPNSIWHFEKIFFFRFQFEPLCVRPTPIQSSYYEFFSESLVTTFTNKISENPWTNRTIRNAIKYEQS